MIAGAASLRSIGSTTVELLAEHGAKVVVELHGTVDCMVKSSAIVKSPPLLDKLVQNFDLMPTRDRCGANDDDLPARVGFDLAKDR